MNKTNKSFLIVISVLKILLVSSAHDVSANSTNTGTQVAQRNDSLTSTKSSTDFVYSTNNDGSITINNYIGKNTELTIPAQIDGHAIKEIASHAFDSKNLTSVKVSEGIEIIDGYSFQNNPMLYSISFPTTLKTIGEKAFQFCGIRSIKLPGDTYVSKNYWVGSFGSQNIFKNNVEKTSFIEDEHGNNLINLQSLFNIDSNINQDLNTPKVSNIVDQNGHDINFDPTKNIIIVPDDVTSLSFNFASKAKEDGQLDYWASSYSGNYVINFKDLSNINGSNYTMSVGDPKPTASDFKASATNFSGKKISVNIDFSKANLNKTGNYEVTLSSENGKSKNVQLFVKNKETPENNNPSNSTDESKSNNSNQPKVSNNSNQPKVSNNNNQPKVSNNNRQQQMPDTSKKDNDSSIIFAFLPVAIGSFILFYLLKSKK